MRVLSETQSKMGLNPVGLVASMERIGIFSTGRMCANEYADIFEVESPSTGDFVLSPGPKKICGTTIFESRNEGRDLQCGACAIRESDCIRDLAKVFWAKRSGSQKRIAQTEAHAHQRIVYSGFEKQMKSIFAQAEKMFNYELGRVLEDKRRSEEADRQEVIRLAKRRAEVNAAASSLRRGEDLG